MKKKNIFKLAALMKKAARRTSSKANIAHNTKKNPWLWILSGALAGVLISSSIFMKFNAPSQNVLPKQPIKTTTKAKPKAVPIEDKKPVFEFYTVLPTMNPATTQPAKLTEPAQLQKNAIAEKTTPETTNVLKKYLVQIKMFDKMNTADELKAELTLAGFDAKIESVQKHNTTLYRVIIGPFNSEQQAIKQQKVLINQNIHGSLIKLEPYMLKN